MAPRRKTRKAKAFEFVKLPFEIQKEIFQYLLVAGDDQTLRPEEPHSKHNKSCFPPKKHPRYIYNTWFPGPEEPPRNPCYHETLNTQVLHVSKNFSAVAVQVLYGCNRFHFSSVSLFSKFIDTIDPLGVQSLRHLVIDYPTCRSFQIFSLRRIVMGEEILDLQVLELNLRNENRSYWQTERGPSAAAGRFIDLLEGRKVSESLGNNEILFAIKDTFDVNTAEVGDQLAMVAEQVKKRDRDVAERVYENHKVDEYCTIKLTRRSK